MALLDHLQEYADKLDKKTVSDKIWPNLVSCVSVKSVVPDRSRSKLGSTIQYPLSVKRLSGLSSSFLIRLVISQILLAYIFTTENPVVQRTYPQQRPPPFPREDAS